MPPEEVLTGVAPLDGFVHRSERTVMGLTGVHAYREGCWFHLQTWIRPTSDETIDEWEELREIVFRHPRRVTMSRLADEVERFGAEYADGTKATTLYDPSQRDGRPPWEQEVPDHPVLRHHGGRGGGASDDPMETGHSLWLWPLPPGERFDLVVEWPAVGISFTRITLDGDAIREAAARAQPIWPNSDH